MGLYSNIGLSAYYSKPKFSRGLEPLVYHSIAAAIERHPALSAIPVDEDKVSAYFVQLPKIDLQQGVSFVDWKLSEGALDDLQPDEQLRNLLITQHNLDHYGNYGTVPFW
jgi:hypothetical protein